MSSNTGADCPAVGHNCLVGCQRHTTRLPGPLVRALSKRLICRWTRVPGRVSGSLHVLTEICSGWRWRSRIYRIVPVWRLASSTRVPGRWHVAAGKRRPCDDTATTSEHLDDYRPTGQRVTRHCTTWPNWRPPVFTELGENKTTSFCFVRSRSGTNLLHGIRRVDIAHACAAWNAVEPKELGKRTSWRTSSPRLFIFGFCSLPKPNKFLLRVRPPTPIRKNIILIRNVLKRI